MMMTTTMATPNDVGNYHSNGIDEMEMEEVEDTYPLIFTDDKLQMNTLSALNMMRKNRRFCDVVLHVGNMEIHAHRAILASVSPYLFELFSNEEDQKRTENVITYKLNGGFDRKALQLLIDYAYTASLEVPFDQVKAVYLAACHLKIYRVAKRCAQHLIKHLSTENCIEIRSLPGIARNREFVLQVDSYIAKEFDKISTNPSLLNLACTRIEILNQSKQEMSLINHNSLCRLVLDWIRKQLGEDLQVSQLPERTHMLYLAIDNSLQDCSSLPTGDVCDTDIVQDYKKMSLKNVVNGNSKSKRKSLVQPSKPRVLIYSREIGEDLESETEPDWNLIASAKVAEHTFLALVTIAGKLATLSVHLRLNMPSTPSPISTPNLSRSTSEEKPDLYCALAKMSKSRCAVGCGNLNNSLIVCGGYDSFGCLKTAEQYNPDSNTWTALPQMKDHRGRFQIAVLDGKIYAIGGSNGRTEVDTVEMLDLAIGKWIALPKLPLAKSTPGVCDLDGLIYCVGGWSGKAGTKQSDVFDPVTKTWSPIAPLNIGRYQAGVTSYGKLIYAIGGGESWNCLNSVEVYDPKENVWTLSKPIITARRGCGVAVFNNRLYVVGGSDGSYSLSSTEIFDADTETWVVGPSMTTPRANVEVVVVGNRLYAVGGFSGKIFLNTIEYLDENSNEWTTFVPKDYEYRRSRTSSRISISECCEEKKNGDLLNGTENGQTV